MFNYTMTMKKSKIEQKIKALVLIDLNKINKIIKINLIKYKLIV